MMSPGSTQVRQLAQFLWRSPRSDLAVRLVAHTVLMDRLVVEVTSTFHDEGIDVLALKGPVLARWLYPTEIRVCADADLLVASKSRVAAVAALRRLGFEAGWRSRLVLMLPGDPGGVEYHRGSTAAERFMVRCSARYARRQQARWDTIDLHCSIPGLFGDPDLIWSELFTTSEWLTIANADVAVPNRDFALLHICLHAAQHRGSRHNAVEDLRRAIARADYGQWLRALALARAYDGVEAFGAGLRCVPEGHGLARRLALDEPRSLRFALNRNRGMVTRRLAAMNPSGVGPAQTLLASAHQVVPPSEHMRRWREHWARHGSLGLPGVYLWRITCACHRLILRLPRIYRGHRR
jgi:hypothetical protein